MIITCCRSVRYNERRAYSDDIRCDLGCAKSACFSGVALIFQIEVFDQEKGNGDHEISAHKFTSCIPSVLRLIEADCTSGWPFSD